MNITRRELFGHVAFGTVGVALSEPTVNENPNGLPVLDFIENENGWVTLDPGLIEEVFASKAWEITGQCPLGLYVVQSARVWLQPQDAMSVERAYQLANNIAKDKLYHGEVELRRSMHVMRVDRPVLRLRLLRVSNGCRYYLSDSMHITINPTTESRFVDHAIPPSMIWMPIQPELASIAEAAIDVSIANEEKG